MSRKYLQNTIKDTIIQHKEVIFSVDTNFKSSKQLIEKCIE